jgi:uncharacterized protein (DUF1684 family)
MKATGWIMVLIVVVIGAVTFYSLSPASGDEGYEVRLLEERKDKDHYMKTSPDSPFAEDPESFKGLNYFAPDRTFNVKAHLVPIQDKKVRIIATSAGQENQYLEYAWAAFDLNDKPFKLLLLEVMAMGPTRGTLFLAFADATSARETYGAGRYIDIKKVPGASTIELDFNKAYNPYCAYSDKFECPLPPRENILDVSVAAGEKNYH